MNEPARILVVDDEAEVCLSLHEVLTEEGYDVAAVRSGEAALARLAGQEFDLALVDLHLGTMDGMDILAALRRQWPDTAIIILTAHGSLDTAVRSLRHGVHDYLSKPCRAADLQDSVRRALLKRQEERQHRIQLARLESTLLQGVKDLRASLGLQAGAVDASYSSEATDRSVIKRAGLTVDLAQYTAELDGHPLDLSRAEFDLLAYLITQAPRVVPAQELLRHVQGYDTEPEEARELMRYQVYHIRQKVQAVDPCADPIQTIRGVGYKIRP